MVLSHAATNAALTLDFADRRARRLVVTVPIDGPLRALIEAAARQEGGDGS